MWWSARAVVTQQNYNFWAHHAPEIVGGTFACIVLNDNVQTSLFGKVQIKHQDIWMGIVYLGDGCKRYHKRIWKKTNPLCVVDKVTTIGNWS